MRVELFESLGIIANSSLKKKTAAYVAINSFMGINTFAASYGGFTTNCELSSTVGGWTA